MLNGEGAKVIIDSGSGLSVSSGDSLGLANSVLELLGMTREERAKMGQKGIEFSKKEFNKENLITALEIFLKKPKVNHDC